MMGLEETKTGFWGIVVFGVLLGLSIGSLTGWNSFDWQWWAIAVSGNLVFTIWNNS